MRCNNKEKLWSFFFSPFFSISHRGVAAAYLAKSFVWRMHGSDIARRLESPSSADPLMQGNWPIYQNHEETKLQSHRCIKNGSTGPARGMVRGRLGGERGGRGGEEGRGDEEEEEERLTDQQRDNTCHSCQVHASPAGPIIALVSVQLA